MALPGNLKNLFDSTAFVTIVRGTPNRRFTVVEPFEGTQKADSTEAEGTPTGPGLQTDTRLAELEAQLKEKENKYLYLYADFENYKKRAIKERSDAMKFGWEGVARDLIGVADNLDRALSHVPAGTDKNLADGLQMILAQFRTTMQKQGVQLMDTVGKPFDPEFHEAGGQEPSDLPQGTITRELLKGYTLHGRLLRAANVVVSMGPVGS
jgi:molecular chaperone GrpE